MTTTTEAMPMRPRGAARHAANAELAASATRTGADGHPTRRASRAAEVTPSTPTGPPVRPETTGAAVSPPAVPVSTSAAVVDLPSRRALRDHRSSVRSDLGRTVTRAITVPLRSIGTAVASAKAVPVTATAVVACLVVSVATPQTAVAATVQDSMPVFDSQEYTVSDAGELTVQRDGFGVRLRQAPQHAAVDPGVGLTARPGTTSVRPLTGSIPAAGGFGSRWVRGCAACSTDHQGLDFAAPTGTPVLATMSGRVVSAGVFGGYGNQVLLQHADGTQTRYGHLSQIGVRVGQTVSAGERIGAVGSTGVSTGSHLHFEVIIGGTPVDPADWLAARGLL